MCAGANSGKAANLVNKAHIPGARVHLRTCKAISRLGSGLNLLTACLVSRRSLGFIRSIRSGLFTVKSRLTASRRGIRLGSIDVVAPTRIRTVRHRVSTTSRVLPPLRSFVVPKKDHNSTIYRIYHAIYQETRHQVLTLSRDYAVSTSLLTCVGHLSSCLFILSHGVGFGRKGSRVF